jgi:hypothetical protein
VQHLLADLDVPSHELRCALRTPLEDVFDDALPALARQRPEPRTFTPPDLPSSEESHRLLENLAHGSPSESAPQASELSPGNAAPDAGSSSPAALFDEVLAGLVQSDAQTAYLFENAQDQLEIYHRRGRSVKHWRTPANLSADAMIDFISGRILSLRAASNRPGEGVERWVGGRPLSFRPSIEPEHELADALPAREGSEVVTIRLL